MKVTPADKTGVTLVIFAPDNSNRGNFIVKRFVTFKILSLEEQVSKFVCIKGPFTVCVSVSVSGNANFGYNVD